MAGITVQIMEELTEEDHETWRILCTRQSALSAGKASHAFVTGLQNIAFDPSRISNFENINQQLQQRTGWQLIPVTGLLSVKDFFSLIAERKFPCTVWIRSREQLDYIQEPDLFHDVFGHVPILTNQIFCDFMETFAKIVLKHTHNEQALEILSRIWWFTFEFGLIREEGRTKIFGGGILSSRGEVAFSLSSAPMHRPFVLSDVMHTPYRIDRFQETYFVIDSFAQLFDSLHQIEPILEKMLEK